MNRISRTPVCASRQRFQLKPKRHKKISFCIAATGSGGNNIAFTPRRKEHLTTVYAFTLNEGSLVAGIFGFDDEICPNSIDCAQVWTSKTVDDQPAGTRLANMKRAAAQVKV